MYVIDDGVNIGEVGQNLGQEGVDVMDTGSWVSVALGPSTQTVGRPKSLTIKMPTMMVVVMESNEGRGGAGWECLGQGG